MTDKEKIRAEIERLNKEWRLCDYRITARLCDSAEGKYRCEAYNELLEFIDSISEEPVSEDLEKVAEKQSNCYYLNEVLSHDDYEVLQERLKNNFKAGARWQKDQDINKACEWLKCQKEMIGISFEDDFIERFRKAMED